MNLPNKQIFLMKLVFLLLIFFSLVYGSINKTVTKFRYGKHFPNGVAAVGHIYSIKGTWKEMKPLEYRWNYYQQYATPKHPFDKETLIRYANGQKFTTCRDANGYLLWGNGERDEIDPNAHGFAFHEHNAIGKDGRIGGNPFTQFWFDDNWLARHMSEAYGKQHPAGLRNIKKFLRWRIMSGDSSFWNPYGSDHFDTLALDGLFYLSKNDIEKAKLKWKRILEKAQSRYDGSIQQYVYDKIHENYHLGLFGILNGFLFQLEPNSIEFLNHYISIRSNIISNQEIDTNNNLLGWRSDRTRDNSLINTESVSVNSLALSVDSLMTFEVGKHPLKMDSHNYYIRPYNVLSAVRGLSRAGRMIIGSIQLTKGNYKIHFFLRSPVELIRRIANIQLIQFGRILNNFNVEKLNSDNNWTMISLKFDVEDGNFEFILNWSGYQNLDLSCVRIQK